MRTSVVAALLVALAACGAPQESRTIAIAGAVLIDGTGGPPLTDSLVIIGGGKILAAGRRTDLSIPAGTNVIDGGGQYIVPLPIDVSGASLPHISSVAEARSAVSAGTKALIGVPRETDASDPGFLADLRDLRVVVAPSLSTAGSGLDAARRNTQRLFAAGVPIAVAGNGDVLREAELLMDSGIPPLDVMVAATRNGAQARGELATRGVIQAGKRADLLLLTANPGEDIRNLRRVARRMENGEWR
jgi:imidazolonepropionase-like amidohydrolase